MAKFVLLFHDDAEPAVTLSPDDVRTIVGEFSDWAGLLQDQGRLLGGQKLAKFAFFVMLTLAAANTVTTFLECGPGQSFRLHEVVLEP